MDDSVIVVLNWVYGFGNNARVEGIYKTVEEARKDFRPLEALFRASGEPPLKYFEVPFGMSSLDYNKAYLLFPEDEEEEENESKK